MSLNFHDLIEERRIDREGYECEICGWRSHTEVNRHPELHEGLICERCADRLAAEQEAGPFFTVVLSIKKHLHVDPSL